MQVVGSEPAPEPAAPEVLGPAGFDVAVPAAPGTTSNVPESAPPFDVDGCIPPGKARSFPELQPASPIHPDTVPTQAHFVIVVSPETRAGSVRDTMSEETRRGADRS